MRCSHSEKKFIVLKARGPWCGRSLTQAHAKMARGESPAVSKGNSGCVGKIKKIFLSGGRFLLNLIGGITPALFGGKYAEKNGEGGW